MPRSRSREVALELLTRALGGGAPIRLQPRGRCMEPLIRTGDLVTVRAGDPRPGDVALIRDPAGDLVCHRVLATTGRLLLAAGDRSANARGHSHGDVLGIVQGIQKGHSTLPLDATWTRLTSRLQAAVHLLWLGSRRSPARWLLRLLHRLLGESHRLSWWLSESASRSSIRGTSAVLRPASSR